MRLRILPAEIGKLPFGARQEALQRLVNGMLNDRGKCPLGQYNAGPTVNVLHACHNTASRYWQVDPTWSEDNALCQAIVDEINAKAAAAQPMKCRRRRIVKIKAAPRLDPKIDQRKLRALFTRAVRITVELWTLQDQISALVGRDLPDLRRVIEDEAIDVGATKSAPSPKVAGNRLAVHVSTLHEEKPKPRWRDHDMFDRKKKTKDVYDLDPVDESTQEGIDDE